MLVRLVIVLIQSGYRTFKEKIEKNGLWYNHEVVHYIPVEWCYCTLNTTHTHGFHMSKVPLANKNSPYNSSARWGDLISLEPFLLCHNKRNTWFLSISNIREHTCKLIFNKIWIYYYLSGCWTAQILKIKTASLRSNTQFNAVLILSWFFNNIYGSLAHCRSGSAARMLNSTLHGFSHGVYSRCVWRQK